MLVVISIVSHNQGDLIDNLLNDLDQYWNANSTLLNILITKNIPEPNWSPKSTKHNIKVIENLHPKGFGKNHNCAFETTKPDIFLIVNPDIRLNSSLDVDSFQALTKGLAIQSPIVLSPEGDVEDFFRQRLTPMNIIKRKLKLNSNKPQEWLAGMFLIINYETYQKLGGFDEKFFMYVEDCDLSIRARDIGAFVGPIKSWSVVHNAQRKTTQSSRHFFWHLGSLLYFWKKELFKIIRFRK